MTHTKSNPPYSVCPVTDPATLTALYDNNSDPRNQADLKALQAASAKAFASSGMLHERVVLGGEQWDWADLFRPLEKPGPLPVMLFVHLCLQKRSKSRLMVSELLILAWSLRNCVVKYLKAPICLNSRAVVSILVRWP